MTISPISLSFLLQINDVNPNSLYQLAIQGIEIERINLQSHESSYNTVGYTQSLNRIYEYQRILSIIRGDTLNKIAGKIQSVN
jgi:hypothetical protein